MSGDEPRPAGPAEIAEHDGAIVIALEQQLDMLDREEAEFQRHALAIAHELLNQSELRVKAEMARYGMDMRAAITRRRSGHSRALASSRPPRGSCGRGLSRQALAG